MEIKKVKWNWHKKTVAEEVFKLHGTSNYADCFLSAEGESIEAHRMVLAAASPYLKNLLTHAESKDSLPIIFLSGVSFGDLCKIVEFSYTGKLEIAMSRYNTFLKAASELQIVGIQNYQIDTLPNDPVEAKEEPKVPVVQSARKPFIQKSIKTYGKVRCNTTNYFSPKVAHRIKPAKEECRYCSSPYKNISTLRNHERFCTANPNHAISRCPICNQEVKPGSMTFHKRTKHGYTPNIA